MEKVSRKFVSHHMRLLKKGFTEEQAYRCARARTASNPSSPSQRDSTALCIDVWQIPPLSMVGRPMVPERVGLTTAGFLPAACRCSLVKEELVSQYKGFETRHMAVLAAVTTQSSAACIHLNYLRSFPHPHRSVMF